MKKPAIAKKAILILCAVLLMLPLVASLTPAASAYDPDARAEEKREEEEREAYERLSWTEKAALAPRSDDPGETIVSIAYSQLGYTEGEKGYTIYGDLYGLPYHDWCAMFAIFCIREAGIDDMPVHAHCESWSEMLREAHLYHLQGSVYVPKAGDIVFIDYGRDRKADHCGIVLYVDLDKNYIETIEGNHNDSVGIGSYRLDNRRFIGFGSLPHGTMPLFVPKAEEAVQ